MGAIYGAKQKVASSERVRVAALACVNCVLAVLFIMLLLADGVQAAGI
jgi:hypothetical protein